MAFALTPVGFLGLGASIHGRTRRGPRSILAPGESRKWGRSSPTDRAEIAGACPPSQPERSGCRLLLGSLLRGGLLGSLLRGRLSRRLVLRCHLTHLLSVISGSRAQQSSTWRSSSAPRFGSNAGYVLRARGHHQTCSSRWRPQRARSCDFCSLTRLSITAQSRSRSAKLA